MSAEGPGGPQGGAPMDRDVFAAMDQALSLYERLGQTDALGRLCWSMTEHLAWAARWSDAVAVAQRGLAALGDLPNPDRARMLAAIGWILGLSGDYAAASVMLAQGRTLAERLADDQALADVLHLTPSSTWPMPNSPTESRTAYAPPRSLRPTRRCGS